MVGPGVVTHANLVNGLRVKQLQKAPLNANGFLSKCQNWSDTFVGGRCRQSCSRDAPMTDAHDLSDGPELAVTETLEKAAQKHKAAEDQAFADKLAKRPPTNPVERAEIKKARKRTKARAQRIAMHIENRGEAGSVVYPAHSDDEGHEYRLADAFGTRSRQFVYSMLNGLGKATEDHSLDYNFSPGNPNQLAFNAALAVIDG